MVSSKSRLILLFCIYLASYWLLAGIGTYLFFGKTILYFQNNPHLRNPGILLSIKWMFISSFIATTCCFAFAQKIFDKTNSDDYAILGFFIGNLSIVLLCFFDGFFHIQDWGSLITPLLLIIMPPIELLFAYALKAALIAVIPSVLSAELIYGMQIRKFKKTNTHSKI